MPEARSGRAGDAEGDGVFGREVADALEAADPDGIAGEQVLVLVDLGGEVVEEGAGSDSKKPERRLQRDAADAEVAGHHALAADGLEDAQQLFALAEAVEEDGERADVHGVRAEPDEVRVDARELVEAARGATGRVRGFRVRGAFRPPGSRPGCWSSAQR